LFIIKKFGFFTTSTLLIYVMSTLIGFCYRFIIDFYNFFSPSLFNSECDI